MLGDHQPVFCETYELITKVRRKFENINETWFLAASLLYDRLK